MGKGTHLQPSLVLHVAKFFQFFYFADQGRGVEHDTVPDDTDLPRVKYSRRDKMENDLLLSHYNGMACISTTLIADDNIGEFAKQIDNLTFTFIAPLKSKRYYIRHIPKPPLSATGALMR